MQTFAELAASRRRWIDEVLIPWCRQAALKDLKKAELEWDNLAGSVDPEATLWTWAWSRFPDLVHEGMPGVNETHEVEVTLTDGSTLTGFPDARNSTQGRLVLLGTGEDEDDRPLSIDEIAAVRRL